MDIAKKQDVLNKKAEQHKTMDTAKKENFLRNAKRNFTVTIVVGRHWIHLLNSLKRK